MKRLAWLGLVIMASACPGFAQEASGPLPSAPTPQLGPHLASYDAGSTALRQPPSPIASTRSAVSFRPASPINARTADSKFLLLNGSLLAMAAFDVEMTQRCLADHHCRERNPLMPSSQAGQLSLNLGLIAGVSGASYWLKRHRSGAWWFPSTTGIAAHMAGAVTGIEHQ